MEKLGADQVIDRTKIDIIKNLEKSSYDVIFDTTGKYSFTKLKYAIKKGGTLVSTIPSMATFPPFSWVFPAVTGKYYKALMVNCNKQDLELVGHWMKSGEIHSVPIDSTFDVKNIQSARERYDDSKKSGRVVIKVADGW